MEIRFCFSLGPPQGKCRMLTKSDKGITTVAPQMECGCAEGPLRSLPGYRRSGLSIVPAPRQSSGAKFFPHILQCHSGCAGMRLG